MATTPPAPSTRRRGRPGAELALTDEERPGVPRTVTDDLVEALDTASGEVIGSLHAPHRATEFEKFLDRIDTEVPDQLEVHLILDNDANHTTPAIKRWLIRHPRFHLHCIPTSSSWLNIVERWFCELTMEKIRRCLRPVSAMPQSPCELQEQDTRLLPGLAHAVAVEPVTVADRRSRRRAGPARSV